MAITGDRVSAYAALVQNVARTSTNYKGLDDFLNTKDQSTHAPTRFTVVKLFENSTFDANQIDEFIGAARLAQELDQPNIKDNCRLFLVENVCSETICLLGERFDIDPQFFADHLSNEPWYRIAKVAGRIPALPSSQKYHDFLQLTYIEPRQISNYQYSLESPHNVEADSSAESDAQSFMMPDITTTRVPRKAGKLRPRVTKDRVFESLLCTRQSVTIWFKQNELGTKGWNGVILLDPPFQLPPGEAYCEPAGYRSFNRRASVIGEPQSFTPPSSNREALALHLRERFSSDPALLESAKADCFFALGDIYRLVASNWIVMNEYVNREMATIEYILEKEEPTFRDLEVYLKDLYIFRRRVTKYYELVTQTKEQCSSRGQQRWPRDETSKLASDHAKDIEGDFIYLQDKFQGTARRIEKNINLLTALVSIGEGKQALDENHALRRLSFLAMVFIPFSTVATIFSIQGEYGPGQSLFWLFWVVAVPLTVVVLLLSALYYGIGASFWRWVAGKEGN